MIGKLKGIIDSSYADNLIIDVGGIGYKVYCPGKTLASFAKGSRAELYIETHVREDHIHLYGFTTIEEKNTFNILQTVKGVGTRMALAILSEMTPTQIQLALSAQDKSAFNKVSGVGKKLSERIITELKDKFLAGESDFNIITTNNDTKGKNQDSTTFNDAINALISLGINRSDAYSRVANITSKTPELDINSIIRLALQSNT